jgi:hypothetical protein
MGRPTAADRDRDPTGRARNARTRDDLGRPQARSDGSQSAIDEPARPPGEALLAAQELLDGGRPFTAHEVLEAVWKDTSGPSRELWRGLAQIAVGITHALRGNESGARSLLQRGSLTLTEFEGTTPHGVDVDGVRAWAEAASDNLRLAAQPPRLVVVASASGS